MRIAGICLLIILSVQPASSHVQAVHQYIAREGYALLLKTYGADIPQLSQSIGLADPSCAGDSAWQKGFVTTGAWREDDEDVVYHYDILPGLNYALTSITHFWSADRGDGTDNMIRLQVERPPLPPVNTDIGPFPNALAKMMSFAQGGWVVNYPRAILCRNTANDHFLVITPVVSAAGFGIPLSYNGLTSFYSTRTLSVRSDKPNVCAVLDVNTLSVINLSDVAEIQVESSVRDIVTWEVLGRMCHLLADMSMPAHAHLDEHGLNPDSYEDYVSGAGEPYKVWDAENVGAPIIPSLPPDQLLHFLMYTMQEQADHFGSNGPADGNGNDNIGGDATVAERKYLNALVLSSFGGPTTDAGPWTTANLDAIRDKTLPFAIRATGGLLYWFCVSTGMIHPLTSAVNDQHSHDPLVVTLGQNYPNPFNPATVIGYTIAGARGLGLGASWVRLEVYDILGREVATLVNEMKQPGTYSVVFSAQGRSPAASVGSTGRAGASGGNTNGPASGVYIYRLTAGNRVESRRMLFVK